MQALKIKLKLLTTLLAILFSLNAHAGDLDDDIKMDDGLDKYDSISQPSMNTATSSAAPRPRPPETAL
jgi:hypothetical protein